MEENGVSGSEGCGFLPKVIAGQVRLCKDNFTRLDWLRRIRFARDSSATEIRLGLRSDYCLDYGRCGKAFIQLWRVNQ